MNIERDKLFHIAAGAIGYAVARALGLDPNLCLLAATAAGVAKEVYDHVNERGTVDGNDVTATMAGGLAAHLVWVFLA